MFENLLGKKKSNINDKELIEKIDKMNLIDMKTYISGRILNFRIDENGLNEVMRKLLKVNENTSKRYINIDDMDSKIQKCFNLILTILVSKKITVTTIELVNEFLTVSKDIIEKYDKENKEIYSSRFKNALTSAIDGINKYVELEREINILK